MTAHEYLEKYNPILKDELQKVRRRGEVCKEMQEYADHHFKEKVKELKKCDVCNDTQDINMICSDCIIDKCNDRI